MKNNSNINKAHKYFINLLIYSNIKPKNKSEKYKIKANLTKFYNDKNETKKSKFYFDIQKKNSIEITKLPKASFQHSEENKQNDELLLNMNNFNDMPSFTKELRRALYSNSDIQSFKHSSSSSINHSFNQNNNESAQILERISEEHMHEDNQTLSYTNTSSSQSTLNYGELENFYLYDNCDNSNNEYILKYEHLINIAKLSDNEISYLSDNISFSEFISNLPKSNITYYNGAFLIPELVNVNQILCDTTETNQYKLLDVGKTLSIPILFEYFLTPNETSSNLSVSKSLAFDIKTSLMREPDHYILTVTAKYDYSQSVASTQSYANLVDGLKIS